MQAWDEAIYAMRSISIVEHGDWLDQTANACGGFYSSSYPPLYIWLSAATMFIFGESAIAIRIWSVIFAVATIFLIFFIPKDRRVGLIAAVTLATLPIYYLFARAGQLDSTFTFFIFLGIFFWIKSENPARHKSANKWTALTGLAFGLALMSKIIVGLFLPLTLFVYLAINSAHGRQINWPAFKKLAKVAIIGLAIAIPWHLYMYTVHGMSFVNYFFEYHIFRRALAAVTIHSKKLGALYYVNQLIIIFSAASVFLFHRRILKTIFTANAMYFAAFCVPFLIFTYSTSKLISYTIPMMPALALLIAVSAIAIYEDKKVSLPLMLSSIIIAAWSLSQVLRTETKQLLITHALSPESYLIISAASVTMIAVSIFKNKITGRYFVLSIAIFMIARLIFTTPMDRSKSIIESAAVEFKKNNYENLIFVTPTDKIRIVNPQISYYFGGIDLGWRIDKHFKYYQKAAALKEINYDSLSNAMIILRIKYFTAMDKEYIKFIKEKCRFLMGDTEFEVYVKDMNAPSQ